MDDLPTKPVATVSARGAIGLAVADARLLIRTDASAVLADPAGRVLWTHPLDRGDAAPSIVWLDGVACLASADGRTIIGLDGDSGHMRWSHEVDAPITWPGVAVQNGDVVALNGREVVRIEPTSGKHCEREAIDPPARALATVGDLRLLAEAHRVRIEGGGGQSIDCSAVFRFVVSNGAAAFAGKMPDARGAFWVVTADAKVHGPHGAIESADDALLLPLGGSRLLVVPVESPTAIMIDLERRATVWRHDFGTGSEVTAAAMHRDAVLVCGVGTMGKGIVRRVALETGETLAEAMMPDIPTKVLAEGDWLAVAGFSGVYVFHSPK